MSLAPPTSPCVPTPSPALCCWPCPCSWSRVGWGRGRPQGWRRVWRGGSVLPPPLPTGTTTTTTTDTATTTRPGNNGVRLSGPVIRPSVIKEMWTSCLITRICYLTDRDRPLPGYTSWECGGTPGYMGCRAGESGVRGCLATMSARPCGIVLTLISVHWE